VAAVPGRVTRALTSGQISRACGGAAERRVRAHLSSTGSGPSSRSIRCRARSAAFRGLVSVFIPARWDAGTGSFGDVRKRYERVGQRSDL